ncbi:hypothetical protein Tco_0708016 [Tanacetum coccineum]
MNTRLNIEKLDGNIVQKHGSSKQGSQGDREAEVFQVSNDDTVVAQRWLDDKQPEEKTNTDCLVKEQEKEYHNRWKIKTDMLGFFGWLASIKQGMLELVKVKCIFLGYHKGIVGNKLWRLDDVTSKVVLYRNMGFNESGKYNKTFIGSGVVAAVKKIYAHESLTFNDTVACEVISKWKARLKEEMQPSISNVLQQHGMVFLAGARLRSGLPKSRFYNGKLVQTLLEGHSILSLEGSLSRDCDVEKNGKWSCIYAVGSQEYQVVCTRLDIASEDVGMLDKFDRGLQTDVQVLVDFDYVMGRSITVMGRSITRYGLMIQECAGR